MENIYKAPQHQGAMRQLVKSLQDSGVSLLLAADDGWDIHVEMAALVRAGLSPYQALLTGTRNPAQYFGRLASTGTVTVGKRADLLLLHDNPLTDIRHTRELAGVMIAGHWLDRARLDQGLLTSNSWLGWAVSQRGIGLHPKGDTLDMPLKQLAALADSVSMAKPPEYERLVHRVSEKLGMIRASLKTPEQREIFDSVVRVWLREQTRQGYRVAVTGTASPS